MCAYASGIRPCNSSPIAPYWLRMIWNLCIVSDSNPWPPWMCPDALPSIKSRIIHINTTLCRCVAGITASTKTSRSVAKLLKTSIVRVRKWWVVIIKNEHYYKSSVQFSITYHILPPGLTSHQTPFDKSSQSSRRQYGSMWSRERRVCQQVEQTSVPTHQLEYLSRRDSVGGFFVWIGRYHALSMWGQVHVYIVQAAFLLNFK